MTEWGVYLVLASLLATGMMLARPITALTKINTRLECAVERLSEAMNKLEGRVTRFEDELHGLSVSLTRQKAEIKNLRGGKKAG